MARKVLDGKLLDALERIEEKPFNEDVWRVTWATRDPLAGSQAGGRWSSEGSFEALYTSCEKDGAVAEIYHHLSLAPVFSRSDCYVNHLKVSLSKVLHLDVEQLKNVGIADPKAYRIDKEQSQNIGDAAHMLDYQGIVVPSARWPCVNLVIFLDRVDINKDLTLINHEEINWPAWREKIKIQ